MKNAPIEPTKAADRKKAFTILHTNDMHSNLIGVGPASDYTPNVINDDKTIGGFARVGAVIAERRKARQGQGPVLVLDAGDYSMGTAFGAAIRETGGELQLLFQRLAVSDVAAERSAELSAASDVLAAHGADELATAVAAGAVAKDAAEAGVAEIAAGAEEVGKGKAAVVAGEAMQERAAQ